jgi:hypothetical protein
MSDCRNDHGHRFAGERREQRLQPAGVDGEIGRAWRIVGKPAEHGLGTTQKYRRLRAHTI